MTQASQKNSLLLVLLVFFSKIAFACDFCSLLDYGNLNNQTSFRIDYKFRKFQGYNQDINFGQNLGNARQGVGLHRALPGVQKTYINHTEDYELFTELNFGFVYNHKGRTNFVLNIPYVRNIDYYGLVIPEIGAGESEKYFYSGIGDISTGIQKIFSKEKDIFKHTFKLSGLIHLPTGASKLSDLFGENIHMQPSRSIYAGDLGFFYTFENLGVWGFVVNSSVYLPFNKNPYRDNYTYLFANSTKEDIQAFKIFEGKLKKIIFLGLKHEYSSKEFINNYELYNTGYQNFFTSLGFTLKSKNILLSASYDLPISQNLNGLQLQTKNSYGISVIHYLPNKKTK